MPRGPYNAQVCFRGSVVLSILIDIMHISYQSVRKSFIAKYAYSTYKEFVLVSQASRQYAETIKIR